jgi:hypothetical protein
MWRDGGEKWPHPCDMRDEVVWRGLWKDLSSECRWAQLAGSGNADGAHSQF